LPLQVREECSPEPFLSLSQYIFFFQIGSLQGEVVEEEEVEKMALGANLKALDVVWMTEEKLLVAEAAVVLVERLVGKVTFPLFFLNYN